VRLTPGLVYELKRLADDLERLDAPVDFGGVLERIGPASGRCDSAGGCLGGHVA
jgi:hypothetical protein